jgi:hypothetical protein
MKQLQLIVLCFLILVAGSPRGAGAEVWQCAGGLFTSNPASGENCFPLATKVMPGEKGHRVFRSSQLQKGNSARSKSAARQKLVHGPVFETESARGLASTTAKGTHLQDAPARRRRCGG